MASSSINKSGHKERYYIFVLGGVMSGVGKGVTTSSIGVILQSYGLNVSIIKADPYLNVDAGTMNPTEHGEVFVLDSGLETDQDMGNYERFLNRSLPAENYMTNGMVFKHVIDSERRLEYKGKCVEPTYHITQEILRRIEESVNKNDADITIFEIGGTIGEYQNAIFIEAVRVLKLKHPRNVMTVLVSYLPTPKTIGEMKTKPTQNAVRQLAGYGVTPDIIIARASQSIDKKRKEKIAEMCGLLDERIISAPDVQSIYEIPLNFEKDSLGKIVLDFFGIDSKDKKLSDEWRAFTQSITATDSKQNLNIAIVGKYFDTGDFILSDAYISVIQALKISEGYLHTSLTLDWINAKDFEDHTKDVSLLQKYDAVVVPGGFGTSGIDGILTALQYCREQQIPTLGICYGMQLMCVEIARNKGMKPDAHTIEVDPHTSTPLVHIMESQIKNLEGSQYGGSMRLGSYPCVLKKESLAYNLYNKETIHERHRHRYEINTFYKTFLEDLGLIFSGTSPDTSLMEIVELSQSEHPFYIGVQFHPEFLARPLSPHPLFTGLLNASLHKKGGTGA